MTRVKGMCGRMPAGMTRNSTVIRAKHQPETRAYLERRIREGKTKREALRAPKRHLSRDLFKRLAEVP
jgi:transposase